LISRQGMKESMLPSSLRPSVEVMLMLTRLGMETISLGSQFQLLIWRYEI
jgi:hypothetical protein